MQQPLARRLAVQEPLEQNEVTVVKREPNQAHDRGNPELTFQAQGAQERGQCEHDQVEHQLAHNGHDDEIEKVSGGAACRSRECV